MARLRFMGGVLGGKPVAEGGSLKKSTLSKPRISIGKNTHAATRQSATRCKSRLERQMQSDRSRLRELEIRVAHPHHWRAGENRINIENLRQLQFRLQDQLEKLRQRAK